MGLALEVGILAALKDEDPEGFEYHAGALKRLNAFLASRGLPQHDEPLDCEVWSAEMIGYSGLHDLRRIAAYLDSNKPLPPPAARDDMQDDACVAGYYAAVDGKQRSFFTRLFGRSNPYRRQFDHLVIHGDAEGYYLPIDFAKVLTLPEHLEVPGGMVGSVQRLLDELDRIARALELPATLSTESDELWAAADEPAPDGELWRRYGRESFGCVTLREGCRKALAARAALVFA